MRVGADSNSVENSAGGKFAPTLQTKNSPGMATDSSKKEALRKQGLQGQNGVLIRRIFTKFENV